jgi:hypothetical protein
VGCSGLDPSNDITKVFDFSKRRIDLFEDPLGLSCRNEASVAPVEQADTERSLGVFHEAAEARGGHVEELCRTRDGSRDHDGPDDLDLAQREHSRGNSSG